jgi:nitrogen fixation protein NifU and related proteins
MTEAQRLYQSVILEHSRKPRGFGLLSQPSHRADGYNPICGDKVVVTISILGDRVKDVGFEAKSCALCQASASILVEDLSGMELSNAQDYLAGFEAMLNGADWKFDGIAGVFQIMTEFPARIKCVLLPWKTFRSALDCPVTTINKARVEFVSTESTGLGES